MNPNIHESFNCTETGYHGAVVGLIGEYRNRRMPNVPLPLGRSQAREIAGAQRDKLLLVAKYQKWVLIAVLFNIIRLVLVVGVGLKILALPQTVSMVFGWLWLAIVLFMIFAIVMVAKELYGVLGAVISGVLMFIPVISLLALLVVNQGATRILSRNGIKVGLMGANLDQI